VSSSNLKVSYLQSICRFSSPLYSYRNEFDRHDEQINSVIKAQINLNALLKESAAKSDVDTYFFSIMLGKAVLKELVKSDIIWAVGAGTFVYLYLSLHMSSFILAFFSLLLIVFSFGITQAVYVWVLGIDYFQALHLMAMFLVLGIAADDIFVFHDAWI
jgi:protein dispatched 1